MFNHSCKLLILIALIGRNQCPPPARTRCRLLHGKRSQTCTSSTFSGSQGNSTAQQRKISGHALVCHNKVCTIVCSPWHEKACDSAGRPSPVIAVVGSFKTRFRSGGSLRQGDPPDHPKYDSNERQGGARR